MLPPEAAGMLSLTFRVLQSPPSGPETAKTLTAMPELGTLFSVPASSNP